MDKQRKQEEFNFPEPKEISFFGMVIDPEASVRRKEQMAEEDIKPEEPEGYKCEVCGAKAGIMNKDVLWTVCPDCYAKRVEKKRQNLKHNVKYWAIPAYLIFILINLLGINRYEYYISSIDCVVVVAVVYSTTSKAAVEVLSKIKMRGIGFLHFLYKAGIILLGFFVRMMHYDSAILFSSFTLLATGIAIYNRQMKRIKKEEAEAQVCKTVQSKYLSKYEEYLQKLSVYEATHVLPELADEQRKSEIILGVAVEQPKPVEYSGGYEIELPTDLEEIAPQK